MPLHEQLLGRPDPLFEADLRANADALRDAIEGQRLLVLGGAGSIGGAVAKKLFSYKPEALHVVDLSENNLAELVRDIRSSMGYIKGDFHAYCLDVLDPEFIAMVSAQPKPYDAVLNFAALKHVRSEKDPYTLMRMIRVNVLGVARAVDAARKGGARLFGVSTDKASNPINAMGATKRIMEQTMMRVADELTVTSARFANVLFSDGSLPFAWKYRLEKGQPIVAPRDIKRYFVTDREAASLCLLALSAGKSRDVLFPKLDAGVNELSFSELAIRYLESRGLTPQLCDDEEEARTLAAKGPTPGEWPCYFFDSDTTGEKDREVFYEDHETVDMDRFAHAGVVRSIADGDIHSLEHFFKEIQKFSDQGAWDKPTLVSLLQQTLKTFSHDERHKYLDERM
ncbi:MAG: SDR family NAD(P)-dependent oxidoreductase [Phycisphaeraceae bacterium]